MVSFGQSFEVFFGLVPTGAVLYAPVFEAGELVDFQFVRINPAGQRLLGLPAQPPRTFREYYPHSVPSGIFCQYCSAYLTGQVTTYDVPYDGDDIDTFFRLVAQRSDELLVVNFTDMGGSSHSAVERALRESHAAERVTRADAEAQRQLLHDVLHQAPVAIALLEGPRYRIAVANPTVCELWDRTQAQLLSHPLFEALPELEGQGIDMLLDGVLHTGELFVGTELPFQLLRHGRIQTIYFNFVYQPQRTAEGTIFGVLVVATDMNQVVMARQQIEAHVAERTREVETARGTAQPPTAPFQPGPGSN